MVLPRYDPCTEAGFLLFAHELVHVVQIQQMGPWLGLFHPFVIHYLICGLIVELAGGDIYLNPYEKEAYDFVDGPTPSGSGKPGLLRKCIASIAATSPPISVISPCECTYPWPEDNPLFKNWPMLCPTGIKATSDAENCAGASIATFLLTLGLGVLDFIVGVFGWIFNNIADFLEGVSDFFTGGGRGGISLLFSEDGGMTWPLVHKFTIDSSSEPPALASDGSKFYISWTGTPDNKINVGRLPFLGLRGIFETSNHDAGPALTYANGQLYSVWQDEDNHLHLRSSVPSPSPSTLNASATLNLDETLAGDATPSITYGNGRFCLAWIGESNHISIKSSVDGINWERAISMGETSPDDGTPALAFGNGRFYLAWTGDNDDNNLFIKSFTLDLNGNPVHLDRHPLPQRSSDDAGPALAFASGGGLNRLFLAWTDDNQQVHVMFSDNPDPSVSSWSRSQVLGHSSDNAGPALAFGSSFGPMGVPPKALVCVAWIDK
jgi:hypothetical protein